MTRSSKRALAPRLAPDRCAAPAAAATGQSATPRLPARRRPPDDGRGSSDDGRSTDRRRRRRRIRRHRLVRRGAAGRRPDRRPGHVPRPEIGFADGSGLGSGFIISPDGLAVTNNHVVAGAATLEVYIGGDLDESYNATILGVSECNDLALIDINGPTTCRTSSGTTAIWPPASTSTPPATRSATRSSR